jgi:hypothetical protein
MVDLRPSDWRNHTLEIWAFHTPLAIAIVIFYFWTALSNGQNPTGDSNNYYPMLATAFIKGQLYLDKVPPAELSRLADPYDPVLNKSYRLHDASFYHGKYYLYFGPTPAVFLFVPYRLIVHGDLPQPISVALFCSAGFLFSAVLFLLVAQDHFGSAALWLKQGCLLGLGLGNICPFLLRRPDVYEVAISCAFAFLQLGFLFFYIGMRNPPAAPAWLIAAMVCIGTSVGARPTYAFASLVFYTVGVFSIWKTCKDGSWKRSAALLAAPLLVIGIVLSWYNWARFGNPLEFGLQYQLASIEMGKIGFFYLDNAAFNLWFNFLAPLTWTETFPFVDAFQPDIYIGHYYGLEKVAGMFQVTPILLFGLAVLPFYRREVRSGLGQPLLFILLLLAGSAAAIFAPLLFVSGATFRYFVDFVPACLLLACLMVCHLYCLPSKGKFKQCCFNTVTIILLLVSCSNAVLLSFTGYYNFFRSGDPDGYAAVAAFFSPLEWLFKTLHHWFA